MSLLRNIKQLVKERSDLHLVKELQHPDIELLKPFVSISECMQGKWKNLLPEIDIIPVKVEITADKKPLIRQGNKKTYEEIVYKNPFDYSNLTKKKKIKRKQKKSPGSSRPPLDDNEKIKEKQKKLPPSLRLPLDDAVGARRWGCVMCPAVADDKEALIKHYEQHKENEIEVNPNEGSSSGSSSSSSNYFYCHICCKDFTSLKSFERHTDLQHGGFLYTCEPCKKGFKNSYQFCLHNYNMHIADNAYHCNHCEFTTEEKSDLKTHVAQHKEDYKYRCEICNKGFTVYSWYLEHENFHTGALPFECDLCGKSFPYTRYLIAHKRSMHPEIYSKTPAVHQCQFCQKRFAHKKSLIIHERCHTGENIVLCDVCGKRLSSSEHLKHHMRIHTGDKPHVCGVCGKGFAKKCNLTLHERVHSGEKPYVCRFCSKSFSQRSTVVIHERYHTGERPYVCRLCNKGFVAKGLLGPHMKTCTMVK